MTTKKRFRNKYRLEIRERDHGPAHVHLVGGNIDVAIDLVTLGSKGRWPSGLQAEVMAWVTENLEDLMKEWSRWHP